MDAWIARLFEKPEFLRMGHHQRAEDLNLGLGWIYYGLARVIRPQRAVVIGSHRGFIPMVVGKALADNGEGGEVTFIDPSMVDDFWKDAAAVNAHFAGYDLTNVRHHLMTTQQFVTSDAYAALDDVGLLIVDGYHSAEQARFDHEAFIDRLRPEAMVLFHDSVRIRPSRIYGADATYDHRVKDYMDELKLNKDLQVFDIAFGGCVTLVQRADVILSPIGKA